MIKKDKTDFRNEVAFMFGPEHVKDADIEGRYEELKQQAKEAHYNDPASGGSLWYDRENTKGNGIFDQVLSKPSYNPTSSSMKTLKTDEDERQWLKEISPYWPLVEVVDSGSGEDPQLVATTLLCKQDEQTGEWMVIHHIEREKYDKIDKLVAMRRLHQKINQSVYISMLFYDVSAMREYNRADGQPVDDKSRLQISEQERMKKKLQ